MVGLPARGKSYLSKTIVRYMNSIGCPTQLFNAGNKRRQSGKAGEDASFFDPNNEDAKDFREWCAMQCLEDLLDWFQTEHPRGCSIGILDATNTTVERRQKIIQRCQQETDERDSCLKLIFVESYADNQELLEQNYRMKLANEDYKGKDPQQALADFRERVAKYEAVYERITDRDHPDIRYIQMINAGEKLITKGAEGYVLRKLQRLLGAIHLWPRTIWLALCGETEFDLQNILGGDPELTADGIDYSAGVAKLIQERQGASKEGLHTESGHGNLVIYTGTYKRYLKMAEIICETQKEQQCNSRTSDCQLLPMANTNDLCEGLLDSTTETQRHEKFPREAAARKADKLNYRYPGVGGESYQDLIARTNELICLLEQSRGNSLVICNRAVYRVLMGYFLGHTIEEIPHLEVKPGVLELRRNETGFSKTQLDVNVGKPTSAVGVGTPMVCQNH
eukprot:CAMPEP_0195288240 /NCGR_PEP_ID=MMETSP0707-20130614/4982_1 /TAXON_ID=33640 /ORGANISM="Asterionellopsis glacialis, Strain CCMP134" /LENGTH=450 /DNA_ID=CAMNT_0040348077 /DNA_START=332 /DNA_END=1684 /DNA_ORIENTATION=+